MKALMSSTPVLRPVSVYNTRTGEETTLAELQEKLHFLITLVTSTAKKIMENEWVQLVEDCGVKNRITQPAEYARAKGYNPNITEFPAGLLGKSRVQKLVGYSLISTVTGYVRNPNPRKQTPRIGNVLNLGAVDKQMAALSHNPEQNSLTLLFKCWDTEYLIEFSIPEFIRERNVMKWCLPTISKVRNEYVFRFPYQETIPALAKNRLKAGLDLGRAELFTVAVLNQNDQRIASYTASNRSNQINRKRDRLLSERKYILNKFDAYTKLGLNTEVLQVEADRKRGKITRLGTTIEHVIGGEVARKLAKHKLSTVNVEDLKWVAGARYGSKWNHSRQLTAIEHALLRNGTRVKRVNPRNTSQDCSGCGEKIIHNTAKRTVWCAECKSRLDRDYNAALNIAKNKNKNVYPPARGRAGVTVDESQVTGNSPDSLTGMTEKSLLRRSLSKPTFLTQ